MQLNELLTGLELLEFRADPAREITGVSYDSRTVVPGHVFVAIDGTETDGRLYAAEAAAAGAACVVCRQAVAGVPCVVVASPRRALAVISANWFGHPARQLTVVGVTGTNGKTTSACLIRHILERALGTKTGLIGTVENRIGDDVLPARHTTPESRDLQQLLRQMADAGCTHAVMEVSSHALALDRVYGIPFAAAVFTNLTRDHLDFHRTMEDYCDAKAKLFHRCAAAVYNADDPWHERLLRGSTCRRISYGVETPADLRAGHICLGAGGVSYEAVTAEGSIPVRIGIPGRFTVYNTLGAIAVCNVLGVPPVDCAAALDTFGAVRGRMEPVAVPGGAYTVLIDYAHTPDALENVLTTVRGFAAGRVIALFGCGGDRDRTKRPRMGAIAARLADFAVVTSDNPRTEQPSDIIRDILAGMSGCDHYVAVEDRPEAIRRALTLARPGDVVVLCGKGHETYQEIGRTRHHLDEREILAAYFKEN